MKTTLFVSIMFCALMACTPPAIHHDPDDLLLAEVGQNQLYHSHIDDMITSSMSVADSSLMVSAYIERWTREQVMLIEAERTLPSDLNLNQLVEDYRHSLLRLNYEESILQTKLDTVISAEELSVFYEKNKDQYQLEKPIVRCLFMKLPTPVPNEAVIRKAWNKINSDNLIILEDYAIKYAEAYLLADSVWYTIEDLEELIPSDIVNSKNINASTDWTLKAKNFKYYLKVLEMKSRKDIAPLSFIEEQATRAVLHRRKLKTLDAWREELYQKALRENQVNIFSN